MTLTRHELKQGKTSFWVWTVAVGAMIAICVLLFPQMTKDSGSNVGQMFSSMGTFSSAFGLDKLDVGTLIGYYAGHCCNMLGLGGSFFAALCAVSMLSKEEKERTAEFLLTHPVSRIRIVTEKLIAILLQITVLNLIVFAFSAGSIAMIGEEIPWKELLLLHTAYYILQLETAGICFGISAFIRKGSTGLGLGLAAIMFFLKLTVNTAESMGFLKYITPYGYCDGADIVPSGVLDGTKIAIGAAVGIIGIVMAYLHYTRKDIHS